MSMLLTSRTRSRNLHRLTVGPGWDVLSHEDLVPSYEIRSHVPSRGIPSPHIDPISSHEDLVLLSHIINFCYFSYVSSLRFISSHEDRSYLSSYGIPFREDLI